MDSEGLQKSAEQQEIRRVIEPAELPLSVVGLPRDVVDSLAAAGISTLGDFAAHDLEQIVRIYGVGTGSIRRVRRWLDLHGIDAVPDSSGPLLVHHEKRTTTRLTPYPDSAIPPVPDHLLAAPVPLHALPPRIANLLRRHNIRTLQNLYAALFRKSSLEGFGVGTRYDVIESLPRIYAIAQKGHISEVVVQRETLSEAVRRMRKKSGRPVPIQKVALELGLSEAEATIQARQSNEVLFFGSWCLTPDFRGVDDAVSVSQPGEVGQELVRIIERALSERELQVLVRWVGLGRPTLRHGQIARDLERSRERIRQLRQRALTKVSGIPAVHGMLSAMASDALIHKLEEEEFCRLFEKRFGLILGEENAPGLARLCIRGSFGRS